MNDPLAMLLEQTSSSAGQLPESSRYRYVGVATMALPDGTAVAYFRRRFVPQPERLERQAEHRVESGDRLDNLAARYHGDPELFWQIADANRAMRPADLLRPQSDARPRVLRIALPEGLAGPVAAWPR